MRYDRRPKAVKKIVDWREQARKLAALAEDQRGKPEGDVARRKLLALINKHPEAANFHEIQTLVQRDIIMAEAAYICRNGISTEGSWIDTFKNGRRLGAPTSALSSGGSDV